MPLPNDWWIIRLAKYESYKNELAETRRKPDPQLWLEIQW
jgi:hypothetical protein